MSIDHFKIRQAIVENEDFRKLQPELKRVVIEKTIEFVERLIPILIEDQKIKIP